MSTINKPYHSMRNLRDCNTPSQRIAYRILSSLTGRARIGDEIDSVDEDIKDDIFSDLEMIAAEEIESIASNLNLNK